MRTPEFGKSYYWNRRTRQSSWSPPEGSRSSGSELGIQILGAVPSLFLSTALVSGSHLFAVLVGSTVDTCYVSLQRLLWEIAENVSFSARCLVRLWISEMTSWSFLYSAQCLVRQLLREMTS